MINVIFIPITLIIKGEMGFIINKIDYGVAYNDPGLKKGEFVAACAPIYKKDSFTLRMLIRED